MAPGLIQEVDDFGTTSVTEAYLIKLNEVEQKLRRLLLDVAHFIEKTTQHDPIVLRFTGGWVRDKLLGVPSHDIDVAINNMTGYQFGLRMKDYLDVPGNPEKYGLRSVAMSEKQYQQAGTTGKSNIVGGLHKIEANPEKSKHLETVTTRILGLDIDLVNLRKESYTEDSRNPQMEFGTAQEDALRRDATVNAMFYNLNTEQVEDFTGRGHEDMRLQLLRTPLEPYQTFKDDPLRVLRLIRFASRLCWTIEATTLAAMRHTDIKEALKRKISRERVGIELGKALKGPAPREALRLILDLGLYDTVFCDPLDESGTHYTPDVTHAALIFEVLEQLIDNNASVVDILIRDADDNFLAWTLASLIPYRDAPVPEPPQFGRKAPAPLIAQVAREGIKSTSKTCDLVTASVRNVQGIRQLVDSCYQQSRRQDRSATGEDVSTRENLGMHIRAWGPQWRSQVLFALLTDIADQPENAEAFIRKYTTFVQHLKELDILDAYAFKPLMDGKALAKAMSASPGPWMKEALDVVMAWQLRNPDRTDPAAAIEEVKKHGELAFSLAQHFLKLTIRPLFLKSKPVTITNDARAKPKTTSVARNDTPLNDDTAKPWKNVENSNVLGLLTWSVEHTDEAGLRQLWPLVIPPILTLIDDWETRYKQLGCRLLRTVLTHTPAELLQRTGLGPVFENALLPSLTSIPPLVEDKEAAILLPDVYQALIRLAETRYKDASDAGRIHAFDTIIRKGIIYGYAHAGEYPVVVTVLLDQLTILINKLGIEFVKHLRFIVPMLVEVLTSSLSIVQSAVLQSAAKCMHSVIRNGWPRMAVYRGDLLKAVTMCWLNLDDAGQSQGELRKNLRMCASLLQTALNRITAFDEEVELLIAADLRLLPLFEV